MSFYQEYKKCINCIIVLAILICIKTLFGIDTTSWINIALDGMMATLALGATKYSVIKTSERKKINGKAPNLEYDDSSNPEDFIDPMKPHQFDQ